MIGNRDYTVGPLANPLNDARAMAAALRRMNFKVTLVENLKRDDIGWTLDMFMQAVRPKDEVLFFYAGHGVQINGVNYLPAVDANIRAESDVALNSINLNQVLLNLDRRDAGVRLVMLDACRDNPYEKKMLRSSRSEGLARGLARMAEMPAGTLIHYATRPGDVAADGTGPNGLYTTHLLQHLEAPGMQIEPMLKRVAASVRKASGGRQTPWMEGTIEGEFYFVPTKP